MTTRIRQELATAAEQAPMARLSPDVWRRGRRARQRVRVGAAVALVLALATVAGLVPVVTNARAEPAAGGDAVPADLALPWMWQPTVQTHPPGPASVLFGGDTWGLHGSDIFDSEGKVAVLGRGGDTRMQLYFGLDTIIAGEDVQLSPDGTRVAQALLDDPRLTGRGLIVTDLTTGRSTVYPGTDGPDCCAPLAWAPDGRSIVGQQSSSDSPDAPPALRPVLLDLATGSTRPLGPYRLYPQVRTASRAAFAPDGRSVALTDGTELYLTDLNGQTQWTVELGPRRYLAGLGAFTDGGSRILTVTLDGCLDECDEAALAARVWRFGYLDARTGAAIAGPALPAVTGSAVRALGWSQGRDLVALRYTPERGAHKTGTDSWNDTGWLETGHVTLVALRPDGTTATLLDPPDGVLTMDVAHDLLAAGRFGGPSWSAAILPARSIIWVPLAPLLALTVFVAAVLALTLLRRRRRRAASEPDPR